MRVLTGYRLWRKDFKRKSFTHSLIQADEAKKPKKNQKLCSKTADNISNLWKTTSLVLSGISIKSCRKLIANQNYLQWRSKISQWLIVAWLMTAIELKKCSKISKTKRCSQLALIFKKFYPKKIIQTKINSH